MRKTNNYWTLNRLHEEALKFNTRNEFRKLSRSAYTIAKGKGQDVFESICSHMPKHVDQTGINGPNAKYTDIFIFETANKYSSIADFYKNDNLMYHVAHSRGVLDKVCQHMRRQSSWTADNIATEALKYSSRAAFSKGSASAYQMAFRNGILQEVCSHMKYPGDSSLAENTLKDELTSHGFLIEKLKKREQVKDKPYIKGFDIDLYVDTLKKGVEFDGTYWHSFERLKKGRPLWSDEDLHNYHTIKDNYFANYGIQVMHITEADWLKDSNNCVIRCLEFLNEVKS